jgi:hypothetical protein
MYWQYTTALAGCVLAASDPVISNADNAIRAFIWSLLPDLSRRNSGTMSIARILRLIQVKVSPL